MPITTIGVVVIGRNEGAKLERSLHSVREFRGRAVYVDSASSDDSVRVARDLGFAVLELDPALPMSAARARNEGFEALLQAHPDVDVVQFLDGDSEMYADWPAAGLAALQADERTGIVVGAIREREPDASLYHRVCAVEWRQEPGEIAWCGGTLMVRADLFRKLGGFRPDVVAGEEGDFCLRLRKEGHVVRLLPVDMIDHDAEIYTFRQWWLRAVRSGQGYAQLAAVHGADDTGFLRGVASNVVWGGVLPAAFVALARPTRGASLLGFLGYPVLAARVSRHTRAAGWDARQADLYGVFMTISKFAGALGTARFASRAIKGEAPTLIEHSAPARHAAR